VVRDEFPVAAADYVDTHFMGHRIFNNFEWGGFLIFRLFPRFQVSIDGRTQVYGPRIFSEYTSTHYLMAGWWRFLEESKPDVVLWPSHGALAEKLRSLPGWRVVFDDGIAVVLVRSGVQEKIRMYLPRYDSRPIRIGNHRKIGPPPLGMLSAGFTPKAVQPLRGERRSIIMHSVKILNNQRGQGMTEYLIIAILVALVVLFSINRFGHAIRQRFGAATSTVGQVSVTDQGGQSFSTEGDTSFDASTDTK
jgi:Flp pilus assembly pilin Flp